MVTQICFNIFYILNNQIPQTQDTLKVSSSFSYYVSFYLILAITREITLFQLLLQSASLPLLCSISAAAVTSTPHPIVTDSILKTKS